MEPTRSSTVEQQTMPAHKISRAFEQAQQEHRGVLIPYFMCGYPSAEQTVQLVLAAMESGADIVELGIPFSDPLADGATIQHAGHEALQHGMTIRGCMEVAKQIAQHNETPLIFMGYYNPILAYGIERFCIAARESGVSGLIVPDLPPEEADALQMAAYDQGLVLIFLIPPTTPDERIVNIAERSASTPGGFIYCVSLSGVTGARKELPPHLQSFIEHVRSFTRDKHIPLAVGFGLNTPEHIAQVTRYAEGVVVGSAIVNMIDDYKDESEQITAIRKYIHSLSQRP